MGENKASVGVSPVDQGRGQTAVVSLQQDSTSWLRYVPGPAPTYRYKGLSPRSSRVGVVTCGCTCLMLSGINVALMGSVSSTPSYLTRIGLTTGTQHEQLLIGVINAIYFVGVMIGALLIGPVSDTIGRRRAIVCAGIYAMLIIPVFAALQNFAWALSLRFLNGLATGAFDAVGLNWSAEASEPSNRGRDIGLHLCCAALGASQSYFLVYGISKGTDSELLWRLPIAYQCVFVLIVLSVVWFLPESPRWLVRVGLMDEARDVLIAMRADRGDAAEVGLSVDHEVASIRRTLEEELANKVSSSYLGMLFVKDEYHTARRTWSALFVQFATQAMVGVGVVSGYGIKIFVSGGWSAELAALLSGVGIVVQAVFGFPGAIYADKIGRRNSFIYGSLIGSIILAFVGMCAHFSARYTNSNESLAKAYSTGVVALMMVWSAVFGVTWLCAPFTYPSEIFPARTRAKGSSFGIVGLGLGSFFTNMISPYLFSAIEYKSMFLFCGLSFLVTIISYFWLPETAGKSLEDIDHLYD